jgi:tetratricopeptide (TPR) repeat protein
MAIWDKLFKKKQAPPPAPIVRKPVAAPAPPKPTKSPVDFDNTPPKPAQKATAVRKAAEPGTKKLETQARLPDAKTYTARAKERVIAGDVEGALRDCERALAIDPEFADGYGIRGVARERKGDAAGAKADYSKMIEIQIRNEISRQVRDNPEVEV